MAKKLGGLGKGLNAIFIENDSETEGGTVTLKISEIEPNRTQPRKEFDEQALSELAESISQHGLLQPLLVRPLTLGGYQIVAGIGKLLDYNRDFGKTCHTATRLLLMNMVFHRKKLQSRLENPVPQLQMH